MRQEITRLQSLVPDQQQSQNLNPHMTEVLLDRTHILIRDQEDRIVFWNRGAELLYGWTKAEALGQISHTLLQTVFPVSLEAVNVALRNQGEWEGELRHTCRGGDHIMVASHQMLSRDSHDDPSLFWRSIMTLRSSNRPNRS